MLYIQVGLIFLNIFRALALEKCTDETSKELCYDTDEYLKHEPPKVPTVVNLFATINQILDVDEESHTVKLMVQLTSKWEDERLKIPGLTKMMTKFNLEHHLKDIWAPELFYSNSVKVSVDDKITSLEYAYWPGSKSYFLYTRLVNAEFSCAMEFDTFPFDSQLCIWNLRNLHGRISKNRFSIIIQ